MNKKKFNKKKFSFESVIKPLIFFLLIFVLIFTIYRLYQNNFLKDYSIKLVEQFSQNYNYLLKTIEVNNINNIKESKIKNFFLEYKNKSIFLIPVKDISYKISLINWVESVYIKNDYKNTIIVNVNEHIPAGIYLGNNALLFNQKLQIIDYIKEDDENYYKLIKISGKYSLINSKLLLNSIPHSLLNKVDKAMYISERRWDIILKNGLYLKLAENKISDSLENYIKIIKNISNDELKKIESIDLRIPNKAIIKFIK